MYQVPALGLGLSLKFLSAISSSTAIITGSFIAESFINTLPWYIGLSWLSNIKVFWSINIIVDHVEKSTIKWTVWRLAHPSAEVQCFTLVYQSIRGATQFGSLRLNPYGSPCPLVSLCRLRGDWPISPSKFHAYPSYRSVHWLLVKQWVWDLLLKFKLNGFFIWW